MRDASTLLRDVASDISGEAASGVGKAGNKAGEAGGKAGGKLSEYADKLRPSEDALASIDRPEADNVVVEAPDFEKAKSKIPFQTKSEASEDGSTEKPTGKEYANNAKKEYEAKAQEYKEQVHGRAEEYKTQAHGKAKDYLAAKLPEERREIFIERLKKVIVEVQGREECGFLWQKFLFLLHFVVYRLIGFLPTDYQAIDTLLYLAEHNIGQGREKVLKNAETAQGAARDVAGNDSVKVILGNLRVCTILVLPFYVRYDSC